MAKTEDLKNLYKRANRGVLTREDKLLAKGDSNYLRRSQGDILNNLSQENLDEDTYLSKVNPETNPFVASVPQREVFRLNAQSRDMYKREREREKEIKEYSSLLGEEDDDLLSSKANRINKTADDIVTAIERYWLPQNTYQYSEKTNTPYSRSLSQVGLYDAWREKAKEYDTYMSVKHKRDYANLTTEEQQKAVDKYQDKTKDYAALSKQWLKAGGSVRYDRYGNPYLDWEKTEERAQRGEAPGPYAILKHILPNGGYYAKHVKTAYGQAAQLAEQDNDYNNLEDVKVIDTSRLTDEEYKQLAPRVIDLYEHKILGEDKAEIRKKDANGLTSVPFSPLKGVGSLTRGVVKSVDDVLALGNTIAKLLKGGLDKETIADRFIQKSALTDKKEIDDYFGEGTYSKILKEQNNNNQLEALQKVVGTNEAADYLKSYRDTYSLTDWFDKWARKLTGSDYKPQEGDIFAEQAEKLGEIATFFLPGSQITKASSKLPVITNVLKKALGFQAGTEATEKLLEKSTLTDADKKEGLSREQNVLDLVLGLLGGEAGARVTPKLLDSFLNKGKNTAEAISTKIKQWREKKPEDVEVYIKQNKLNEQEADVLRMATGHDIADTPVLKERQVFVKKLEKNQQLNQDLIKNLVDLRGKVNINSNNITNYEPAINSYKYSIEELNKKALNDILEKYSIKGKEIKRPQLPVNYRPHEKTASDMKQIIREHISESPENYSEVLEGATFSKPVSNIREARTARNKQWEEAKQALEGETLQFETPFKRAQEYASKIEQEPEGIRPILSDMAKEKNKTLSYGEALELRRSLKRRANQLKAGANPDNRSAYILEDIAHGFDKDLTDAASNNNVIAQKALQANQEYAKSSENIEKKRKLLSSVLGEDYVEKALRAKNILEPDVPEDVAKGLKQLAPSERTRFLEEYNGDSASEHKIRQVWLNDLEHLLDTEEGMRMLSNYNKQDIQTLFGAETGDNLYKLVNQIKEIYNPAKKDWSSQQAIDAVSTAFKEGWEGDQIAKLKNSITEVLDKQGREQLEELFNFNNLEREVLQKNSMYKNIIANDTKGLQKNIQNTNDIDTLDAIEKKMTQIYGSDNKTISSIREQIERAKNAKVLEVLEGAQNKLETLISVKDPQLYIETLKNVFLTLDPKRALVGKLLGEKKIGENFNEFCNGCEELLKIQESIQNKINTYTTALQKQYNKSFGLLEKARNKNQKVIEGFERREAAQWGALGFSFWEHGLTFSNIIGGVLLHNLRKFMRNRQEIKKSKLANNPDYIKHIMKLGVQQSKSWSNSLDKIYQVVSRSLQDFNTTDLKQLLSESGLQMIEIFGNQN